MWRCWGEGVKWQGSSALRQEALNVSRDRGTRLCAISARLDMSNAFTSLSHCFGLSLSSGCMVRPKAAGHE
jgi:hypothetical protein